MRRITSPIELTPEKLAELRFWYRPGGSGPLSVMRKVVQLVEQIAEEKGIDLDEVEWTSITQRADGTDRRVRKMKGLHPMEEESGETGDEGLGH